MSPNTDGKQVWLTLKDVGRTMVFNAVPPFDMLRVLDTGPITNQGLSIVGFADFMAKVAA